LWACLISSGIFHAGQCFAASFSIFLGKNFRPKQIQNSFKVVEMKSIIRPFLILMLFTFFGVNQTHAQVGVEADVPLCADPVFAKGHWLVSFENQEVLRSELDEVESSENLVVLEKFDHVPLKNGKTAAWDGALIGLKSRSGISSLDPQSLHQELDRLITHRGGSLACVVRASFDRNMNFLGF
jgi:hypothetical protein